MVILSTRTCSPAYAMATVELERAAIVAGVRRT
jgi:hypothetical protein